jgi:hypothetical protein
VAFILHINDDEPPQIHTDFLFADARNVSIDAPGDLMLYAR